CRLCRAWVRSHLARFRPRRAALEGCFGRFVSISATTTDPVAICLNQEDFSPLPPVPARQADTAVLAGLTHIIGWLTDDDMSQTSNRKVMTMARIQLPSRRTIPAGESESKAR